MKLEQLSILLMKKISGNWAFHLRLHPLINKSFALKGLKAVSISLTLASYSSLDAIELLFAQLKTSLLKILLSFSMPSGLASV